jgi:hypothetical protein
MDWNVVVSWFVQLVSNDPNCFSRSSKSSSIVSPFPKSVRASSSDIILLSWDRAGRAGGISESLGGSGEDESVGESGPEGDGVAEVVTEGIVMESVKFAPGFSPRSRFFMNWHSFFELAKIIRGSSEGQRNNEGAKT